MLRLLVFVLLTFLVAQCSSHSSGEIHTSSAPTYGTVIVSTMDGSLRALDMSTGEVKWSLQEGPVLRAPNSVKQGFTFLPNPQDGSLYVLKEGNLKKLPFTIPQLVHASPCKGNDGVLYAGSKKDVWFSIDPITGKKIETLSSATTERVCPANKMHTVFVGRTEYRVRMFDTANTGKTWNATFSDYSAHLLPVDNSYPLKHYVSASSGAILAVDQSTGQIIWERDLHTTTVAMYLLQEDGLHKLPFTVVGKETMENLLKNAFSTDWTNVAILDASKNTLFPSLYVGESQFGLYAISSYIDEHTISFAPKYLGPPLLEGPSPIAITNEDKQQFVPPRRPVVNSPTITYKTTDGEYLILGYHETPPLHFGSFIPARFPEVQTVHSLPYKPDSPPPVKPAPITSSELPYTLYLTNPLILSLVATVFVLIISIIWICWRQNNNSSSFVVLPGEARSAQTSRVSNSGGRQWTFTRNDDVPDGWLNVGKLLYNPSDVLGRGCEGTVVYRGKFDGREVAVKRVVSEFVRLVDREADLLRESDAHQHVIRYFCMESDSQFRYLALELCVASLADFVEQKKAREKIKISNVELLRQATDGLTHLHAANIVHRDIKPQNILLSVNQRGQARAVISDFGLCKRIQNGRHSLSQRSGMAGTDGWIAPEALFSESTGQPVDVFSLGCIFYYVLSGGKHPFGDSLHRQANIINGEYNITQLKEGGNAALSLIEVMLRRDPKERPPASSILFHPFFWSADRRLQFFGDVSDRVEKEDEGSPIVRRLESNARAIVAGGWKNMICEHLAEDLRKFRTYKNHSVRDLLRAMRNKKHHYRELPELVQKSLGHIPNEFLLYFTSRFPLLLMHSYESLEWCANEPIFRGYYPDEVRERMKDIIRKEAEERKEDEFNVNSPKWVRGKTIAKSPENNKSPKHQPVA